jgi:NAD(P)H-nitrite reductase large subunit
VFKYLIVGNSAGGVGAVEGIREADRAGSIAVISDEPYAAYSRPLITYYLADQVELKNVNYRPHDFYRLHGIETLLGNKAVELNIKESKVVLSDGKEVVFEKLLLATGGKPFVPPIVGSDKQGVFTFTSLDDAKKVKKLLPRVKHAVVIGGGLIGLKVAEALAQREVKTTVVELADRVLSPVLDPHASHLVQDIFRKQSVEISTSRTVKEILGGEKDSDIAAGVALDDGREIPCDLVVIAIGVVPRTDLAQGNMEVNRGIVVDDHMAASADGIYAAGDVAEAYDVLWDQKRVTPIWPNAYLQGRVAGLNMAGKEALYPGGMGMNSTTFFGFPIVSAGICNLEDPRFEMVVRNGKNGYYKKLVLEQGRIKGMIFAGAIDRAGIICGLIKDAVNVQRFKGALMAEDFGFVSLPDKVRKERLTVRS